MRPRRSRQLRSTRRRAHLRVSIRKGAGRWAGLRLVERLANNRGQVIVQPEVDPSGIDASMLNFETVGGPSL